MVAVDGDPLKDVTTLESEVCDEGRRSGEELIMPSERDYIERQ
jgi:hypothetical protein